MKSPFPGMDPYLELHWRDVHQSLAVYARDQLQAKLPGDLIARVEEQVYVEPHDMEPRGRTIYPDVRVTEHEGRGAEWQEGGVAVTCSNRPADGDPCDFMTHHGSTNTFHLPKRHRNQAIGFSVCVVVIGVASAYDAWVDTANDRRALAAMFSAERTARESRKGSPALGRR